MSAYETVTPELLTKIETQDSAEQRTWLFLEPSDEFRGCWQVDGLYPEWFLDLEELVGSYRVVTPAGLPHFLETVKAMGYQPVFVEDPLEILNAYEHLNDDPPVSLNSELENTRKGFLPWQRVGFNKLVREETIKTGYIVWDTGAGKTAFIASAIKYHQEHGHPFDFAMVVVKSHNKIATQRKLLALAGIESIIIDGKIEKRYDIYEHLQDCLEKNQQIVLITNYEKFREDKEVFKFLFKRREALFFWDEMPTKLANRTTQLYRAVKECLYQSFYSKPRLQWTRHWILTATPIENSPDDLYSCVNLLWPGLLGSVGEFYNIHACGINPLTRKPFGWKNLDHLEAKLGFMTHRVSKQDPEVAALFPEEIPMPSPIDWNPKHRMLYDNLSGKAHDMLLEFADANILSLIQVMQMVCDAPSMVRQSAANRQAFLTMLNKLDDIDDLPKLSGPQGSEVALALAESVDSKLLTDVGHTKLETWHEIIEKHSSDKIVTHSTWADYIFPVWAYWLQKWGISYIFYAGTDKQRQEALDRFRSDPDIQVFLSGDSGSDSIDIPEARIGVNYNIPWKWTTITQRKGRRDRVNSTFDTILTYSLIMPDSVDERKAAVCDKKHGYHIAIFDGRAQEEATSATMTRDDLLYILLGTNDNLD